MLKSQVRFNQITNPRLSCTPSGRHTTKPSRCSQKHVESAAYPSVTLSVPDVSFAVRIDDFRKLMNKKYKSISLYDFQTVSVSAQDGTVALGKARTRSASSLSPRNSANICLVEHRSFSILEGGISAASLLHSSKQNVTRCRVSSICLCV